MSRGFSRRRGSGVIVTSFGRFSFAPQVQSTGKCPSRSRVKREDYYSDDPEDEELDEEPEENAGMAHSNFGVVRGSPVEYEEEEEEDEDEDTRDVEKKEQGYGEEEEEDADLPRARRRARAKSSPVQTPRGRSSGNGSGRGAQRKRRAISNGATNGPSNVEGECTCIMCDKGPPEVYSQLSPSAPQQRTTKNEWGFGVDFNDVQ